MVSLESKHPSIYREFAKGNFTIRKSTRVFSNMVIDQAHEQSNAVVKGDGGAIGLTEDSAALRRWMVAGPEISRLVGEFESSIGLGRDTNSEKHHEDSPTAQKDFWNKIQRLIQVFIDYENPFQEESTDIHKLDSKEVVKSEVGKIANLLETGSRQYDNLKSGLTNMTGFYDPIKKNNVPLIQMTPF